MALARPKPDCCSELSESDLIAAVRDGSSDALGELYDRHARALLAIAFRLLQSTDDAEDVVHDVFVGLPELLRRYDERGAFAAWLKKIAARVALTHIREGSERPTVSLDELSDQPHVSPRDVEGVMSLEQAMRDLTPALRAVLVLKEIEGFSHAEVARLLDISVGASEVRLHRAIQALRAALTRGEQQ
ncbi:MAG: RNA polymerase sigma factor [Gemmatimonadaceae bacterium]